MVSTFLSRIIGLVRVKYIVWLFGRGVAADAFNAAFVLPDDYIARTGMQAEICQ